MISGFSLLTSSLRSVVQILMEHFTIFQLCRLSGCFVPKHYEKLCEFVKVTAKILSVPFFFSGHGVQSGKMTVVWAQLSRITDCWKSDLSRRQFVTLGCSL